MKKHELQTLLYSVVGVAAMFVIVVAVNFIFGLLNQRIDLTEEGLFTLSDGTRSILKKLDGPVEIRFYATQGENEMPIQLKSYAQRVQDLLGEYKKASRGRIVIKPFDPKPDSDAEDSATMDGIEGQPTATGERIYLGLAVSYADAKSALPFLSPGRENLLEYDVSRAISQVISQQKKVLGMMSSLPVFGQPPNPMMMRTGQRPAEPIVLVSELRQDFTVKEVALDVEKIDDDITELLVIHPKNISDKAQYAIDQFLMRGGKLMVLVDPLAVMDRTPAQNPMMPSMPGASNMEKLFKAWGITFESTKVVADMRFAKEISLQRGAPPQLMPGFLFVDPQGILEDVVTSQLDNLWIPFAGAFSGTPAEGLAKTVLLKSTTESQLVDGFLAQMSGEAIAKDFKASGKNMELAIRLTGKFKTAFPEGKPAAKEEDKEGDASKPENKPADTGPSLKESSSETAVILVGDADFIFDDFCVQILPLGQKIYIPRNGNLTLVQNMAEQMSGDNELIAVRSRATLNRPFEKVRELQAKAEDRHREELKRLETKLQEAQQRLNELQSKKEGSQQRFILSPEQQSELAKFKLEERQTRARVKEVRKQLRKDIDSLENTIKWLNIAGMPFLVVVTGLSVALIKRQRTRAR